VAFLVPELEEVVVFSVGREAGEVSLFTQLE